MAVDRRRPIESRERADPLGRAMLDYQRGEYGRLRYRDGVDERDGRVHEYYFRPPEEWNDRTTRMLERLGEHEPILDVGCGAGQHALWWQERDVEVTAVDASPNAVRAASERGVRDARVMDMFDLESDPDRFGAVHAVGTQLGLAGSIDGIRDLLAEFARVARTDGITVVDNYDPTRLDDSFLGYRSDPREGIARRTFHFEYVRDGDADATGEEGGTSGSVEVGPTLSFLLCSPDRLREATIGTPWTTAAVRRSDESAHYVARLEKTD